MPAPIHGKRQDPTSPLKTCSRCRIDKPRTREFFSPAKRTSDNLTSACKKCMCELTTTRGRSSQEEFERTGFITSEASRTANQERERERFRKDPSKKRAKIETWRRWRVSSIRAWMSISICGARWRAQKDGLEFSISCSDLVALYVSQEGRCAITGETLTMSCGKGRLPSNLSIDRIDSSRGYVKDNVQLATFMANTIKRDLTMDGLRDFCIKVLARTSHGTIREIS